MSCEIFIVQGVINTMKEYNEKHEKKCQEYRKLPKYYKFNERLNTKLQEVTERINELNAYTIKYHGKIIGLSVFEEKTILLHNLNLILEDMRYVRRKIVELKSYKNICEVCDDNLLQIKEYTNYLHTLY
jgi:protein tyrosine phosphatase